MSLAADKKRWDALHADLDAKSEALLKYEIELGGKYGHNFQRSWLSSAQRNKLEKLRDAQDKIGDKVFDLVLKVSPRGEKWRSGVPMWWVRRELTWEDAIKPESEELSVVVPGAYGYQDGYVKEEDPMARKPKLYKALFYFDEGIAVEGWTTGERWNGWGVPSFDHSQLRAVAEALRAGGLDVWGVKDGGRLPRGDLPDGAELHIIDPNGDVPTDVIPQGDDGLWHFLGYTWNQEDPRRKRDTMNEETAPDAEAAGEQYAYDQINSDHFMDWVRDQLAEASRMDPSTVLPLETEADARKIAHNMLQQLEWDTKRDLDDREIEKMINDDATRENTRAFYEGFKRALDASRDWLADELLTINQELRGGGGVKEAPSSHTPRQIQDFKNGFAEGYRAGRHGETDIEGRLPSPEFAEGVRWGLHAGTGSTPAPGRFEKALSDAVGAWTSGGGGVEEDRRRGPRGEAQRRLTRSTARPGMHVRVVDGDSMYRGKVGVIVEPDARKLAQLDDFNRGFLKRGAVLVEQRNGALFVVQANALEAESENPIDRRARETRRR